MNELILVLGVSILYPLLRLPIPFKPRMCVLLYLHYMKELLPYECFLVSGQFTIIIIIIKYLVANVVSKTKKNPNKL